MHFIACLLASLFLCANWDICTGEKKYTAIWPTPEQVHLSLGASLDQMVVTWVTLYNVSGKSTVQYGVAERNDDKMNNTECGTKSEYLNEGELKRKVYVHRVILKNLTSNTTYRYIVGNDESGWSDSFFFTTLPTEDNWQPNILVIGDLGNYAAYTLGAIQKDALLNGNDRFHMLIHLGDFAYDMKDDDGQMSDAFFRQIEPVAAYMPYQVCAGNHEQWFNFSHYNSRFAMYSQGDSEMNNFFWSYNIGPVHFVLFNTEFYYFKQFGTHQIMNQYRWLEEDLKKANANRAKQPWIVTVGHRPLYNQNYINNVLRVGTKEAPGLEKLFFDNAVDLEFWGHDHIYERMWPVFNKIVKNGTGDSVYTNPGAPVHITTGSAGCVLPPPHLNPRMPHFHAFASRDYSYTRLKVIDCKTLKLEQVNNNFKIIDSFSIVKDKHGNFNCQ